MMNKTIKGLYHTFFYKDKGKLIVVDGQKCVTYGTVTWLLRKSDIDLFCKKYGTFK